MRLDSLLDKSADSLELGPGLGDRTLGFAQTGSGLADLFPPGAASQLREPRGRRGARRLRRGELGRDPGLVLSNDQLADLYVRALDSGDLDNPLLCLGDQLDSVSFKSPDGESLIGFSITRADTKNQEYPQRRDQRWRTLARGVTNMFMAARRFCTAWWSA